MERRWVRWRFAAEAVPPCPPGDDDAEWEVGGLPVERVWREYRAEVAWTRRIVEGMPLDRPAELGGRFRTPEEAPSLGRILFHLLPAGADTHGGKL